MGVRVFKYRVKSKAMPESVTSQMRLAHRLRNALVEIEKQYDDKKAAVWASAPDLVAAEEAVTDADARVQTLRERAAEERKQDRSTVPRPGTKKALTDARKTLREAKSDRRAKKALLYPTIEPEFVKLGDWRKAEQKALYAQFVQTDGLFWATFNAVLDDHKTAVKRVGADRKAGRPADLRFRRWDGRARIAVQLQRGAGQPERSPGLLASEESRWRNVLEVGPWVHPDDFGSRSRPEQKRVARSGRFRMRVGTNPETGEKQWFEGQVILHRMMPSGADITGAELVQEVVGGKPRWHLCVTLKEPDAPEKSGETVIAVHTGWRSQGDGRVQVATWRATRPMPPVPAGLTGIITRSEDGTQGRVLSPARWPDDVAHLDGLRSTADRARDQIKPVLVAWVDSNEHDLTHGKDQVPLTAAAVERWRSPDRIARLAADIIERDPSQSELVGAWLRQDRHLRDWHANRTDRLTANRADLWANVAAWTATADTVIVDNTPVRDLTRVPDVGTEDTAQAAIARRYRSFTAPALLRAQIEQTAKLAGCATEKRDAVTRTHLVCGTLSDTDPADPKRLWCAECGQLFDQDHNAAAAMLAA